MMVGCRWQNLLGPEACPNSSPLVSPIGALTAEPPMREDDASITPIRCQPWSGNVRVSA